MTPENKQSHVKRKFLPQYKCEFGSETADGFKMAAHRDKIGNVTFAFWKFGAGFKTDQEIRMKNIKELKKLRDWLTKIIDYVERK